MDYIWVIEDPGQPGHRIAHTQGHQYRVDEALYRGVPFRGLRSDGIPVLRGYFIGNRHFDKQIIRDTFPHLNISHFELKNPRTNEWEKFE